MDILLVNSFHETHIHSFSWGVLSNASYLKKKNFEVKILDGSYYVHRKQTFFDELSQLIEKIKLVGFTCFSTDVYEVKRMIDFIKEKKPEIKVIVGGPHAVLLPEQTCAYKNIDFVAFGNGEKTLENLIPKVNSSESDFSDVSGLIYKVKGEIKKTPPAIVTEFYDMDYELLPKEKIDTYKNYIQVLAGRGCSFRCTFCYNAITGQKWSPRPIEELMDEIEVLIKKYGTKQVYFRDENFFQSKNRILEFIKMYKAKGFTFKWRATTRANYFKESYVNLELLKELEDINCEELKFGLESGSERVLKYLKKGIKVQKVKDMIANIAKVKIKGNYSFLIGIPTETYEDFQATLNLIKDIKDTDPNANVIGPQYYRVYPGGELYNDIVKKYDFSQPNSFEEWADAVKNDTLGLDKDVDYPWIDIEHRDLAKFSDIMMLLYGKSIRELLTFKKIFSIPFVLLAKYRVKNGYYKNLIDMKFVYYMFKKLHMH